MRVTPTTLAVTAIPGVAAWLGRAKARILEGLGVRRRKLVAWGRAFRASGRSRALLGGRVEVLLPGLPGPVVADVGAAWLQEWLAGGEPWVRQLKRWERWQPARRDLLIFGAGEGALGFTLQQRLDAGRRVLAVEDRPAHADLLFENVRGAPFSHRLEAVGSQAVCAMVEDSSWHIGLVLILPDAGLAGVVPRLGRLIARHQPVVLLPLFEHLLEREDSCADAILGRLRGYGYALLPADRPQEKLPVRFNGWLAAFPQGHEVPSAR